MAVDQTAAGLGYAIGQASSLPYVNSAAQGGSNMAPDPYADVGGSSSYVTAPGMPVGVPQDYRAFAGVSYEGYLGQTPNVEYRKPKYDYSDLAMAAQQSPEQTLALQMRLYNLGALTQIDYPGMFDEGTHDALEQAMTVANTRGWSIDQLEKYMQDNRKDFRDMGILAGGAYGGSGGGAAPDYSPTTTTSVATTDSTNVSVNDSVNLTGRGSARAILEQAWAAEMGRDPTGKEFNRFLAYLHNKEREHPTTTKTTSKTHSKSTTSTTTDPSKSGDTSVTSDTDSNSRTNTNTVNRESNVDPANTAENFAQRHGGKEAKAFQTGQYMTALDSLIAGG